MRAHHQERPRDRRRERSCLLVVSLTRGGCASFVHGFDYGSCDDLRHTQSTGVTQGFSFEQHDIADRLLQSAVPNKPSDVIEQYFRGRAKQCATEDNCFRIKQVDEVGAGCADMGCGFGQSAIGKAISAAAASAMISMVILPGSSYADRGPWRIRPC